MPVYRFTTIIELIWSKCEFNNKTNLCVISDIGVAEQSDRFGKIIRGHKNVCIRNWILVKRCNANDSRYGWWHSIQWYWSDEQSGSVVACIKTSITSILATNTNHHSHRLHTKDRRLFSTGQSQMVYGLVFMRSFAWCGYSAQCKHFKCILIHCWASIAKQCTDSPRRRLLVLAGESMIYEPF